MRGEGDGGALGAELVLFLKTRLMAVVCIQKQETSSCCKLYRGFEPGMIERNQSRGHCHGMFIGLGLK